ncbi:MAG: patatin-like phospholipase family protein, partial [Thermodesulfobacteriota bacterium]
MKNVAALTILTLFLFSIVPFAAIAQKSAPGKETPYALTISGGISLGVYEAGLNWVLIENLKDNQGDYPLEAITGASAGAINTIISAIRFAEHGDFDDWGKIDHNLFRSTWLNIDIKDLMPDKQSQYDQLELDLGGSGKETLRDSLFSRQVFTEVIANLKTLAEEPRYKENIRLNIALIVTRSKPLETRFPTTTGLQSVHSQRFVIPLVVTTEKTPGENHARLIFKNDRQYAEKKGNAMEHLFMPESAGVVKFDQVMRAALASSAFPMAFGRVNMQYCVSEQVNDPAAKVSYGICPENYLLSGGFFIDGGTFDNVPIGVAIDMIDQKSNDGKARAANYVYMDPANRRSTMPTSDTESRDSGSLTLQNQLGTWTPAFATLMNGELYRTLLQKFAIGGPDEETNNENRRRTLLLTRRFPPLTGSYISHFGAFFDPAFRSYDYGVGIYDGLMNIVDYRCNPKMFSPASTDRTCTETEKAELFLALAENTIDLESEASRNDQSLQLVGEFLAWEKGTPPWANTIARFPKADKSTATFAVYRAIRKVESSNFDEFLSILEDDKDKFSPQIRKMINNRENWEIDLMYQALNRLIDLETRDKGDFEQPLKAASILVNSKKTKDEDTWADFFSTVPTLKSIYRFFPDALALDAAQTGAVVSWQAEPNMLIKDNFSVELAASLHFQIKEIQDKRVHFWSSGANFRHSFRNVGFSSMGIGFNINQN